MIFNKDMLEDIEVREASAAAWDAFIAASVKLAEAQEAGKPETEVEALQAEADQLEAEYRGIEGPDVMTDEETDAVIRCAASGAPLWETDDVMIRNADTNCMVLADFLELPPPPGSDEAEELAATYN